MLFVFLAACGPPGEANRTDQVIIALDVAGLTATGLRDDAAGRSDHAACVGWSAVAATAPVASGVLAQARKGPLTEIPAVEWDASSCGVPETGTVNVGKVREYLGLSMGVAQHAIDAWYPGVGECAIYQTAQAAVAFVHSAAEPAVQAIERGMWKVSIPVTPIVLDCPGRPGSNPAPEEEVPEVPADSEEPTPATPPVVLPGLP